MSTPVSGSVAACTACLSGWVEGEPWSRWRVSGEGQVRFWLRPIVGSEAGALLCAVPVHTASELRAATEALVPGCQVEIVARPVPMVVSSVAMPAGADAASCVVFLATVCSVAGFPLHITPKPVPADRLGGERHGERVGGKLAAAGDGGREP